MQSKIPKQPEKVWREEEEEEEEDDDDDDEVG